MPDAPDAAETEAIAKLHSLRGAITYLIPVEDGDPYKASFLQGFAPSLMANAGLIRLINSLPSDIFELTPEGHEIRLARRMSGQAPIIWRGQSPKALMSMVTPLELPFTVLMLGHNHKIETYQDWLGAHTFPLTVIGGQGSTIPHEEFSIDRLRDSFLNCCDALEGKVTPNALATAREYLTKWQELEERTLQYQVGGHNAIAPNLAALGVAGFTEMTDGPFGQIGRGIGPYVDVILRTTRSVLEERQRIGDVKANQYFRRPPTINLFAPSIYPHFLEVGIGDAPFSAEEKSRFLAVRRALQRQEGYGFDARSAAQVKALFGGDLENHPAPHLLMQERASELSLGTECVCTLAASELSAVVRLPNAVNRTAGQVRQFAQHYHAKFTTDRKRRDQFRKVQKQITVSIPSEFFEFVEGAEDGVRLITDAHLEWMEVRGLPLCIQKDVTRIPVTPGNLFIDQVLPTPAIHLEVSDFQEILIISALQEHDPISDFLRIAIDGFTPLFRDNLRIRTERVRNRAELVSVLNSYSGSIVFFDGHGGHQKDRAATLQLLEEEIDIWELRLERPRIPPIVILSACDTHAADRNHASTANGFLSIGARTVLGSVFPIDAMDASSFVARLLYRISEFVPAFHKSFNRSLTWLEIMGGMIRMQQLTDFCRRLEQKGIIDSKTYREVHVAGNMAINGGKDWPFEAVVADLVARGIDQKRAWHELRSSVANSTSISYIQMGRPETIVVHPDDGFKDDAEDADADAL